MKLDKKKYRKYFEKWEYGFFEGLICGIVLFAFAIDATKTPPVILLILGVQMLILLILLLSMWQGRKPEVSSSKKPPQQASKPAPPSHTQKISKAQVIEFLEGLSE